MISWIQSRIYGEDHEDEKLQLRNKKIVLTDKMLNDIIKNLNKSEQVQQVDRNYRNKILNIKNKK